MTKKRCAIFSSLEFCDRISLLRHSGIGRSGRHSTSLASRQITTGGKTELIGISKHGNRYLRKLFIDEARTALHLVRDRTSPLSTYPCP
ncbi:transposase [Celeribacter halophilus]|uniref:transposase n=1 Tax=Celeribacter halophilus TaxID=576117 RepID=UPI003A599554